MSVNEILNASVGKFTLGHVLSAALTAAVCLIAVHFVMRVLSKVLNKTKIDGKIKKILLSVVKAALYVFVVFIVASSLGMDVSSLIAVLSVCSLGVTLALEDLLSNLAGGAVILTSHPFRIGDVIESSGVMGVVKEMGLHHTKIETVDGQFIMVPNKILSSSTVVNYSEKGIRRISKVVTASYDASTADVKAALKEAVDKTPGILQNPAPVVCLSDYQESAIAYAVYAWCVWDQFVGVGAALTENIRDAFEAHHVEMTYNHMNIHLVEDKTK